MTIPPPLPGKNPRTRLSALITCGVILLIYAGFFRFAFGLPWLQQAGGVVSLSFVLSVPIACGILSVAIGRFFGSDNWLHQALLLPGAVMVIGLVICIVLRFEAAICVVMALPILIVGLLAGGLLAHWLLPRNRRPPRMYVTFAVFLPFLAAWAEGSLAWPVEIKSITHTIEISAPAEMIWQEIASVRAIEEEEIRSSWIYGIGFPKPIAATLDREGIGGIRTATFERGVSFHETVTAWDEPRRLEFTIHADPDFIPQNAFDRHIIVGGRFYDVLDGIYEIEPLSADRCRLHLTSHHRLGTRFNAYAGWWSVRIMDEIQGTILEVIRKRAEG